MGGSPVLGNHSSVKGCLEDQGEGRGKLVDKVTQQPEANSIWTWGLHRVQCLQELYYTILNDGYSVSLALHIHPEAGPGCEVLYCNMNI